jgi:hypothetical protein
LHVCRGQSVFRDREHRMRWAELRSSLRVAGPRTRPATRPPGLSESSGSVGRITRNVRPTTAGAQAEAG